MAWVVQRLWLALSKWPNGVWVSPPLTTETNAVSEKLFSNRVQRPSIVRTNQNPYLLLQTQYLRSVLQQGIAIRVYAAIIELCTTWSTYNCIGGHAWIRGITRLYFYYVYLSTITYRPVREPLSASNNDIRSQSKKMFMRILETTGRFFRKRTNYPIWSIGKDDDILFSRECVL